MTTAVLVLADTHVSPGRLDRLPAPVWAWAERADVVVHAGDVLTAELLDALRVHAPVHAVLGNNDHDLAGRLPERLQVDVDGVTVAVIHDAGPRKGRPGRLRRLFPDADVAVYGHSHEPDATSVDGLLVFNPGSPTQRRRQPHPTFGVLELDGGRVVSASHVTVER